jgi:hypothetical protein
MKFNIYLRAALFLLFLSVLSVTSFAQLKKEVLEGQGIYGLVMDSLTRNIPSNATVAIYRAGTSGFLKSTHIDENGNFIIQQLPVATRLELKITCAGYLSYQRTFMLQAGNRTKNFGTVLLSNIKNNNALNKIQISGAKTKALSLLGIIMGKVKDSTYKHALSSATVSVYNNLDSALLQFTIPNNFGEFKIQNLPVNIPLKLLVTHVGYTPYKKIFRLEANKSTLDFDWIYMCQNTDRENTLEEVKITSYAPVRMNGDTLEFNPRAFKMDVNATTEDLMRRLPGMVIWGDGDITFNGKKINSLLVDGKPFMGGSDFTIATQNLPKEVLDKVQIYSQRNDKNPLDSTLNANLKLKEDKKMGYFGKAAVGYGTTDRFATDAMLSGYNKKLQISAVGAVNNVNKSANNINTLIKSNSYKGESNSIDYQSDFRRAGVNTATTAGTRFQYDFIPDAGYRRSRRLTGDYLFKQNNETINSTRFVNTLLGTDSILVNNTTGENTNLSRGNTLSAKYSQQEKKFDFTISADADISQNTSSIRNNSEQTRTGLVGQLSNSNSLISLENLRKKIAFESRLNYQEESFDGEEKRKRHLLSRFSLGYGFDYEENTGSRHNLSSISSAIDQRSNRSFDRVYQHRSSSSGHSVNISYPDFKKLLFGYGGLGGIDLDLGGRFNFDQYDTDIQVADAAATTRQYSKNNYLTNYREEKTQDIRPELKISRVFQKGLTNRYNQNLIIFLIPTVQYYGKQSTALQDVQNFNYRYYRFVPNASITYNNHQYGNYELNGSLNYDTEANYPTVEHISPLVDSTNVLYIPKGNLHLKPEYTNAFRLKVSLESRKPKNPYQVELNVDLDLTDDRISDSTFYDNLGRRINYNINLNTYKHWHLGSSFRKSYSPNRSNTYRINIWYNHHRYYIPQYYDAVLNISDNRNNNFDIEITYSFLDIVNVNAKQGISFYENSQSTSGRKYKGLNNYTRFSGSLQFPKKVTWSSNINFNTNKAENQSTVNYTIWNSSVTYRFMQGNRGEVKFSALDILKQNKSIINNTNRNVQTFGFSNVLQQYFMVSLAYYPRKFGKKT